MQYQSIIYSTLIIDVAEDCRKQIISSEGLFPHELYQVSLKHCSGYAIHVAKHQLGATTDTLNNLGMDVSIVGVHEILLSFTLLIFYGRTHYSVILIFYTLTQQFR